MPHIQRKLALYAVAVGLAMTLTAAILGAVRWPPATTLPQVASPQAASPLLFLENSGQFAASARFAVYGEDATMFLADRAIWFSRVAPNQPNEQTKGVRGVNVRQTFVGANTHARIEPYSPLQTRVTYVKGGGASQRPAVVQAWAGVRYVDLYPGIDLLITSNAGQFAQQLVARPGADLDAVRLQVDGAEHMSLHDGQLQLETAVGSFTLPLLAVGAAEAHRIVQFQPALAGNIVSAPFTVAQAASSPDQQAQATKSIGLIYGARFGGSDYDRGNDIAVDGQGAAYVVGGTLSPNMPTTPGAFDPSFGGDVRDAFVAKLNPAGTAPEYITYVGGQKDDWGSDIEVNSQGEAYVTGYTASADFPLVQPVQGFGGQFDAFAIMLSASGTNVRYATFLGGSSDDRAYAISIDSRGAAYIAGLAGDGFPLLNPADTSCAGSDGFVVKLSPAGNAREYATCVGGSARDYAVGIGVNDSGEAYVLGVTRSGDLPTTANAYDRSYHGGDDIFVAKLNASGNGFQYATYLGDTGDDLGGSANVSIARDGSATIAGYTNSPGFPTTGQAFDRSYNGLKDVIVATISASGSGLVYSTFLGGSGDDRANRVVRTTSGALYVGGETDSSDFPTTANAFDRSVDGGKRDVFVTQIVGGNRLGYSTFFGGSGDDNGGAFVIAENADDDEYANIENTDDDEYVNIFMTGATNSYDFPGTLGAYSAAAQGSSDTFVAKLQLKDNTQPETVAPTNTPTKTPTKTPIPSPTPTLRAGETPPPTSTPTDTPTPTRTPSPTYTPSPTSTANVPAQATETSVPTITPYNTPTPQPGSAVEPTTPPSAPELDPTAIPRSPTGGLLFLPLIGHTRKPIELCNDIEDNDSPSQARPMAPIGETCSASFRDDPEGEDDYYSVNVQAGQTLETTLSRVPVQADYDLIVYSARLEQVAVSNKSGEADEQIRYVVPQTGVYLIRINMARESSLATNDYQLSVFVR